MIVAKLVVAMGTFDLSITPNMNIVKTKIMQYSIMVYKRELGIICIENN